MTDQIKKFVEPIQAKLNELSQVAYEAIKAEAMSAMRIDPEIKSFCMAMGSVSFYCEWMEDLDGDGEYIQLDGHLDPHELPNNPHAANITHILDELNSQLYLTGMALKITRDHVVQGEFVIQTDW